MATVPIARRLPLVGAIGFVSLPPLLYAADHLMAPLVPRFVKPRCDFLPTRPGGKPGRTIVAFHGLWAGPSYFKPHLDYLQSQANVLLVTNGARVTDSPEAAIKWLREHDMLGHEIYVLCFSLGSQPFVLFNRLFEQQTGRSVTSAVVNGGMAHPDYVIWPSDFVRIITQVLAGGPITHLGWKRFWLWKAERIRAGLADGVFEHIVERASIHARTVITGSKLLRVGVNLRPGELRGVKVVFVEQTDDNRVLPCYEAWKQAAPNSELVTIPIPGHVSFRDCAEEYLAVYRRWLEVE